MFNYSSLLISFSIVFLSGLPLSKAFSYPFYVGINGGYGSTTWKGLIPTPEKQNSALSISIPNEVVEGGEMWGAFVGHEFTPNFAIEASYKHYPRATVIFDSESIFAFDNEQLQFLSHTETYSLMAKIMTPFANTKVRLYSSAGIAAVIRKDDLLTKEILSPTFGLGFNYNFNEHFMGELGLNYTAGYGESELSPAETYIPFLYSVLVGFSYRF